MPYRNALSSIAALLWFGLFLLLSSFRPETSSTRPPPQKSKTQHLQRKQDRAATDSETRPNIQPTNESAQSTSESEPWWHSPIYSTYKYDPALATDPEYRKFVAHHLFLASFYQSPVRSEKSFQTLLEVFENWGIDPKQEIELVVHANNMAFQYHAAQKSYQDSTGTLSTETERNQAERNRAFTINNMKETFTFLFAEYQKAKFGDLIPIEPSAAFPSFSMKIDTGTLLIQN